MRASPHCHAESPLTGSTVKALVDKAKELGRDYFAYTDHGHLSSSLKAMGFCKPDKSKSATESQKRNIQFIPGIEVYFKDSKCPIVTGSDADRCKYFTISLYCHDQTAYQELSKHVSKEHFPTTQIREEKQQLWAWADLAHMAQFNTSVVLGGPHCIVGKVLLAGKPAQGEQVFLKIKEIFGNRVWSALVVEPMSKKWQNVVEVKFDDGTSTSMLAADMVTTNKARMMKAKDLERSGHFVLINSYSNKMLNEVNKKISSVKIHKGFLPLPGGDAILTVNKFLKALSWKHGANLMVSDYAYYASAGDKIVQTMRLEGNDNIHSSFYMKTAQEVSNYLTNVMGFNPASVDGLLAMNGRWAEQFNGLTLKYDWRLVDSTPNQIKRAMEIIRENGRMKWDDPVWVDRLKEEIQVIVKNPNKDLTGYFLPICDIMTHYSDNGQLTGPARGCLAGDTKVFTNKGLKNLEDITVNDMVIGHSGNLKHVTNTMAYDVQEKLLEIKSEFSWGTIKLTKDHKLLGIKRHETELYKNSSSHKSKIRRLESADIDSRAWGIADNFKKNDMLFVPWPKRVIKTLDRIDLSKFCKSKIVKLEENSFFYSMSKDSLNIFECKRWFEFDEITAKIIGRWIGNGWIKQEKNHACWGIAYHSDDLDGINELSEWAKSLGLSVSFVKHKTKKLVQALVYGETLSGLFKHLFPEYKYKSHAKYLGQFLDLNDSLLKNLLIGLFDADSHMSRNFKRGIAREHMRSTSDTMIGELKLALLYLKIPSSVNTRKSYRYVNCGKICRESYKITFEGLKTPKSKTLLENEDGYMAKITSVSETSENRVFDITVEDDHSYTTSNYAVHNSAGGSLFCYLLGITQVNPIKYGLSFPRFLSNDRLANGDYPDVDSDFADRELLVGKDAKSGYLYGKYGNRAAQISTRHTLRLKSTIKDTNRYFKGKVEPAIESLTDGLPDPPQGVTDSQFVFGYENDGAHVPGLIEISDELKKYVTERPEEWAIVSRAMGITRAFSKHASAFVLSDIPIRDIVPTKEGNITQYEAKACEQAGLIKYDFLVVKNLKDIEVCLNLINKKHGKKPKTGYFTHKGTETYVWDLPEDLEAHRSIWTGSTETIFQISTKAMIPFVKEIKPESVEDISTILALVRPGPLDYIDPKTGRSMAEEYYWRRQGRSTPDLPELAALIPESYGIIVFQEQSLKISKELGGMTPSDAEKLRRLFSKKLKVEALNMKPVFMSTAVPKIGQEKADKIWDMMETSSRYSFNKSHSVAYAMISYAGVFLKHYYPLEWWAAVLTNADEKEITGEFWSYVKDLMMPPDINLSTDTMVVDHSLGKIRSKLGIIRGLGDATIDPIVSGRPYKDIADYVNKEVAGPSLTHKLIHVNVLDSLFPPTANLAEKLLAYENAVQNKIYRDKVAKAESEGRKFRGLAPTGATLPEKYMNLHPLQDAAMRKSVLPSMPIDTTSLGARFSKVLVSHGREIVVMSANGHETSLVSGAELERLDLIDPCKVTKDIYVAATCYVIDAKKFDFSKNTKSALKLILDCDGYISEKVLWPQYDSGILIYPPELKKGAIATFFFKKRVAKKDMSIMSVTVEG